jgi:hypothetical protein
MTRTFVLLLACACALPASAAAQRARPSLEATAGVSLGSGGGYVANAGPALDLLLSAPVGRTGAGTLVAALTGGIRGPIGGDDICVVAEDGGCRADFPGFVSAGAMAGLQRGSAAGGSARLLAGPAYFVSEDSGALGFQGRLDAATPPLFHVSLVASLGGVVLPSYAGEMLTMGSLAVGLRIQ